MLFQNTKHKTIKTALTLYLFDQRIDKSFWAAAPKGLMTYAFTHMGNFLLLLLLLLVLLGQRSRRGGGDFGLKARTWASRLGFRHRD